MKHRVKGDYDDISNYVPKEKPTLSRRERRKNQAIVASVIFGTTFVGTAALVRYTLFADYFKPQEVIRPSAYARPTPRAAGITEETPTKISGVIGAGEEHRVRRQFFQGAPDQPTDPNNPAPAASPVGGATNVAGSKAPELITPGALPYGNPVPVASVAPPPFRPPNLVPEVKVANILPSVTPGMRPIEVPNPGGTVPTTVGSGNRGSNGGGYVPNTPASPPPAPGFGASGIPASAVASGPSVPSLGFPGSSPADAPGAPGGIPAGPGNPRP